MFVKSIGFILLILIIQAGDLFAEGIVIKLKKEAYLDGSEFILGDIASVKAADAKLVENIRNINLGNTPDVNSGKRSVTTSEILYKLKNIGVDVKKVRFDGEENSIVMPKLQKLDSDYIFKSVKQFVVENMPWDSDEVIIEPKRIPANIEVNAGKTDLEIAPISSNQYIGPVRYTVLISVDGRAQKSIDVSLNIIVFKKVVVALKNIRRGEPLNPNNIGLLKKELRPNTQDALTDLQSAMGMVCARNINAHGIIKKEFLQMPAIVFRNEAVQVGIETDGFSVQTIGVAKEDGGLGDYIHVQNLDSKKVYFAKVIGIKRVAVDYVK